MVEERLGLEFFVQCDTQIARQEHLVALLAKAGLLPDVRRRRIVQPPDAAGGPEGTEPSGNVPRHRAPVPRAWNQLALFQHHRLSAGHGAGDVDEHLETLRELGPTWASFYILCPIPGTEQYDDFLAEGLITENNLDRFDTTCLTWRHPCFSREQLSELLFDAIASSSRWGTRCGTCRTR